MPAGARGAGDRQGWPQDTEFEINPSVCTQDVSGNAGAVRGERGCRDGGSIGGLGVNLWPHWDRNLHQIKQKCFSEEPAGVINLLPPPHEVTATVLHSPEAPALHPGASLPRVKDLCGGCSGQAGSTPPSRAHPYVVSLPRAPRAVTSSQRRSQPRTT